MDIVSELFDNMPDEVTYRNDMHKWYVKRGKEVRARYRVEKPHVIKKARTTYYIKHRDRLLKESNERYYRNRELNLEKARKDSKNRHLKYTYKIDLETFNKMVSEQNGKCKICSKEVKLNVDHCHISNKIRGLLCIPCNSAIGRYERYRKEIDEYLK